MDEELERQFRAEVSTGARAEAEDKCIYHREMQESLLNLHPEACYVRQCYTRQFLRSGGQSGQRASLLVYFEGVLCGVVCV